MNQENNMCKATLGLHEKVTNEPRDKMYKATLGLH